MALQDHPLAKDWIAQFTDQNKDEDLARTLINSLRLVSHNTFHKELDETIRLAVAALPSPVAFFAARDLSKGESYFPDKKRRPAATGGAREIGSEGILADVATNWARSDGDRYLNHPPVNTLRRRCCRSFVLLDDLSGSGQRIAKFITAMLRTDSILSWWSFGWITFHVVAYAVSEQAEALVRNTLRTRRSNHADTHVRFWYSRRPIAGPLLWDEHLREQLEEFCNRYAKKGKVKWQFRRGFRDSMGTLVFAHGCPNNVPGILWHNSKIIRPLFRNRTVPTALASVFDQTGPILSPSGLLTALESRNLARGAVIDRLTPMGRNMVLVLSALRKKVSKPDRLSMATNLSQRVCDEVVACCLAHGLVDQNRQLTRRGVEELQAVARLGNLPLEPPEFDGSFYFPQKLRAARE